MQRASSRGVRWAAALGIALLTGCSADEYAGVQVPNAPPETTVTGAPPALEQTSFKVSFFWTATDLDGSVDHYEWRISNNGRDGLVDIADTLGLAWRRTLSTDSTFVVSADLDSFPPDVDDPRRNEHDWRYWQSHTFYVRAVDDLGEPDPSPAALGFTATTLTPTVRITLPAIATGSSCASSARVLGFGWEGDDPDAISRVPVAIRWAFVEVPTCMLRGEYEAANPIASLPDGAWSRWIRYDAPSDSGRSVTLTRQDLGRRFLFAVQAKDQAGAVTPVFDWGVNVRHIEVRATSRPLLRVTEPLIGTFDFASSDGVRSAEVVGGQPINFSWTADASGYGGVITGYRHGWDVQDVTDPNDPGWEGPWGLGDNYRYAPLRTFASGTHNFVAQVIDNSGTVTRGVFQLDLIAIKSRAEQRELLLVQDWPRNKVPAENFLNAGWDDRWDSILSGAVNGFTRGDVVDVVDSPDLYSFRVFKDYKAIVYFMKGGDLRTRFQALFRPGSRTAASFNWFQVYQQRAGNVLLVGPQAIEGTVEYNPPVWRMPLVFSTLESPPLGFGSASSGTSVYAVGTTRYPYVALCVEASDFIRPPSGELSGEGAGFGLQQRTRDCDAMARAVVAEEFVSAFPSAAGNVVDLLPGAERSSNFAASWGPYRLDREEFYNSNTTSRLVSVNPRPCQHTMFKLRARRDVGLIARPDTTCFPQQRARSSLDGVPVALVVDVYGATKPLAGSEDFIWGFNPMAFRQQDVRAALRWIFRDSWQLSVP